MGKKRLSPPPRGPALLHACEMDRSAKQYDHDGGTSAFGRPLFLKKFFVFR